MYINPEYTTEIIPVHPTGTNSTMFTECCAVAICDWEVRCPVCKRLVIGHDAENDFDRGRARWRNATRYWNRVKLYNK